MDFIVVTLSKKWDLKLKILKDDIKNPYLLINIFNFKNM